MVVSVTVNGANYSIPELGDEGWGISTTNWIVAISAATLQKAGGTFTLTAEVDFGVGFGLKSLYYKSRTDDPADAGQIRLARTDSIVWRNAADSGNLLLAVNGSNSLTFNESVVGAVTLQNAYDEGDGIIIASVDKPFQVTGSGIFTETLGVGLTAPDSNLHVKGSTSVGGTIKVEGNDSGHLRMTSGGTGVNYAQIISTRGSVRILTSTSNVAARFEDASTRLFNDGVEAVRIQSNRVGINTDSPTEALHVVGSGIVTGNLDVQGTVFTAPTGTFATSLTLSGLPVSVNSSLIEQQSIFIETPLEKDYTLDSFAKYAYTVDDITVSTSGGASVFSLKINGVVVEGINDKTINTSPTTFTSTSANAVGVTDKFILASSGISVAGDLEATIQFTRSLS